MGAVAGESVGDGLAERTGGFADDDDVAGERLRRRGGGELGQLQRPVVEIENVPSVSQAIAPKASSVAAVTRWLR